MPSSQSPGSSWLVASSLRTFDVDAAFEALGVIDWSETASANIDVGDTVYLYRTAPVSSITHECRVVERGIPFDQVIDDRQFWGDAMSLDERRGRSWMRLRLDYTFSSDQRTLLSLPELKQRGLKAAPQGRMRAPSDVLALIEDVRNELEPQLSDDAVAETAAIETAAVARFRNAIAAGDFSVPDRLVEAKTRGSAQRAFASAVKQNYGYRCAVTGISSPEFLIASHIVPWAADESIRLDPSNGVCLSTLVDRAFDTGFLSINTDGTIDVSGARLKSDPDLAALLEPYDGIALRNPSSSPPRREYIERRLQLDLSHG